jgi:hypothetical protein
MISTDVIVAGGGISGLLIANALASKFSVVLLEQRESIPRNKYWLTDAETVRKNRHLEVCVDNYYESMDFVSYDGLTATVKGDYSLWDTEKLISRLENDAREAGAKILTGHSLYSFSQKTDAIIVRANSQTIRARLLIDCMGFGSPIVGARNVATIKGYYIVHGCEVVLKNHLSPVGLDNVVVNKNPAFFELFPTSRGTAHAALILPSYQYKPSRSMTSELDFILRKSHYSELIAHHPSENRKAYFGIVPVGRLKTAALDRIVFFGEAGQANPAATATALTRMLLVYQELAESIGQCIDRHTLTGRHLTRSMPPYMTRMNRVFQELLFDSLLSFNSDDFRELVQELKDYPSDIVNDMIFAQFSFRKARIARLATHALRPESVLGRHVLKSFARFLGSTR